MNDNFVGNLENDHNELNDDNNFDINVDNNLLDDTTNESPSLKNGVKSRTLTYDWDIANTNFHSKLPTCKTNEKDTNETVKHLTETAYKYFKDNFGLVDSLKQDELEFTEMYKNFAKRQLRKELKQ